MNDQQKMTRRDVYQYVTDRVLDRLEAGEIPWVNTRSKPLLAARSYTTGNRYRGVNAFLLSIQNGASPFWLTFRTTKEAGGNVRKGAKSRIAVFWKTYSPKEELSKPEDERKSYPVLRYYNVFSLDDCEGISCPLADAVDNPDPVERAEGLIAGYIDQTDNGPAVEHGSSGRAFYRVEEDRCVIPQRSHFTSTAAYYRTFFHELVHSTGSKARLDRFETAIATHEFGHNDYSLEELVAELGAAMLLAHCGLFEEMADKSASYLFHWKRALQADSKLIVKAAGRAQRAVDHILGVKPESSPEAE